MKIISAHQPAYLPWLGYFHKICLADEFVLMDDVQFEKNSFINRNRIISATGPLWLTIPVSTKGYKEKRIRDIKVSDDRWRVKHTKAIRQTYGKTEFYDEVMPLVNRTLKIKSQFLIDYTNPLLTDILSYLEVETPVRLASGMEIREKKLDYVIELTKRLGGSHFVFGKLGSDYADKSALRDANLTPHFQDYTHPVYPQPFTPFTPHLSVLDGLFAMGKSLMSLILENNTQKSDILLESKCGMEY